jgi:fructokinase
MSKPTVICFGEVLWDLLPSGKIAGGAPMNVAYHANQLGLRSLMVSRIGNDDLGHDLLDFLDEKGVATHFVQQDDNVPTGVVNVLLDEKGSPSYEIVQPAAWDFIEPNEKVSALVGAADAFVFGSLSCRNERSRETLFDLMDAAKLRVLDVNLRAPFYDKNLLADLLIKADIVKMNDEELALISGYWSKAKSLEDQMNFLLEQFRLETIIVTKGPHGAACLDADGLHQQPGFKVKVKDTIGSGDAFLAAFLSKNLDGADMDESLEFACAIGALVATKRGGTPIIDEDELDEIYDANDEFDA